MPKPLLLILLLLLCLFYASAQPGALDLSFNATGTGANGLVKCIRVLPNDKILISGQFTEYNGTPVGRMVRLHANGELDTTFNIGSGFTSLPVWPGIDGNMQAINTIALQPDGKILVGGAFDTINGQFAGRIVRLHPDGTIDTSFHTGRGIGTIVNDIIVQPDNKIVIGGIFSTYDNLPYNYIVRINPNGSVDTTWNAGPGTNGSVDDLALQPDGKILIGGDFTMYGGNSVNFLQFRLARANTDGSRDTTFSQAGASRSVRSIIVQPDNRLLIAGRFTYYESVAMNRLARLFPGGTLDALQIGTGANDDIEKICLLDDGKMIIAGNFTNYNSYAAGRVARLQSNGAFDTDFNTGIGADEHVWSLAHQPGRNGILIGGNFTEYNGIVRNRIARLYNCLTPQPDSIYGNSYALCSGTPQTYSITPVSGATHYEWTLPNGWVGSSDSATIIATSNGTGGTISVKAFTDSCGWSYTTTRTIATIQPAMVPICLVTVDSASTHNIVMWEKPQTTLIDSFFVYRETSTNIYTKIGAVPFDSLSEYHDYTANPNTTSYRYRLSVLDTCGAESDVSLYHNTIHLQNLGGGNFQWTFYQIENTLNPVLSFNVYRDNNNTGNFQPIGNVPGTNATFTDVTFNSFSNSTYVVDANWSISCNPSRQVNTTRSNIKNKGSIDFVSVASTNWLQQLQIFPNPAHNQITVTLPTNYQLKNVALYNAIGQMVWTETGPLNNSLQINVAHLPQAIYTLSIETDQGIGVKKLAIQ